MKRTATIVLAAALLGLGGAAEAGSGIEELATRRVATGLQFAVGATYAPGDYNRLYILEKPGRIRVLNLRTETLAATPFLDINSIVGGGTSTNNEQGLLGIAFHPNFAKNGYFYVNYTNNSGNTVVARYTALNHDTANAGSAQQVITYSQPFSNHNGGWIAFGPNDGYLYIGTGDGGSAGDPGNRAQTITNQKLGKILRLDVDGGSPYAIPGDNPFVGVTGDDEIWAYGIRNPWRCSFDRATGDLYIADVGQNAWEEINFQAGASDGGENYGWKCREGLANYGGCLPSPRVDPFHVYGHNASGGFSITGGYVYRGQLIPTLADNPTYFFSDYVSGSKIWTVDAGGHATNLTNRFGELFSVNGGFISQVSSFGEDNRGEMYILKQGSGSNGEVFKVISEFPTTSEFDVDGDGIVGFSDLVALLAGWGPCVGCITDFDGDDEVTFNDLVALLAAWS